MADVFTGNWKLSKSENFDEFLSELGIGMIKRKVRSFFLCCYLTPSCNP
jgi:hypothetical protein